MLEGLHQAFGWLCGQNPGHSWAPGGILLPFCQRCTGLYISVAASLALQLALRPEPDSRFLKIHGVFLLIMVPLGFHWIDQGPWVRSTSGVLFGAGLVAFLLFRFGRDAAARPAKATLAYYVGLSLALALILYASSRGGARSGMVLTWLGAAGALGLVGLAIANLLGLAIDLMAIAGRRRKGP